MTGLAGRRRRLGRKPCQSASMQLDGLRLGPGPGRSPLPRPADQQQHHRQQAPRAYPALHGHSALSVGRRAWRQRRRRRSGCQRWTGSHRLAPLGSPFSGQLSLRRRARPELAGRAPSTGACPSAQASSEAGWTRWRRAGARRAVGLSGRGDGSVLPRARAALTSLHRLRSPPLPVPVSRSLALSLSFLPSHPSPRVSPTTPFPSRSPPPPARSRNQTRPSPPYHPPHALRPGLNALPFQGTDLSPSPSSHTQLPLPNHPLPQPCPTLSPPPPRRRPTSARSRPRPPTTTPRRRPSARTLRPRPPTTTTTSRPTTSRSPARSPTARPTTSP